MCTDCGCDSGAKPTGTNLQTGKTVFFKDPHEHVHDDGARHRHVHADGTPHGHAHAPRPTVVSMVDIETRILAKNDALAARNRAWFADRGILALNLMSAPGAGKTTLLERTIRDIRGERPLFVLEGDQATANDGERIRAAGAAVVQINTGTGCHLEADMVAHGVEDLVPVSGSIVIIENVGNLVCPALFDLGEHRKIVVFSVTEGEDKPLKYPHMFQAADLVLLNKTDLLPYLDFDVERALAQVRAVNPNAEVLRVSARTGHGMEVWYAWLGREARTVRADEPAAAD